jgi:hypothetical protein
MTSDSRLSAKLRYKVVFSETVPVLCVVFVNLILQKIPDVTEDFRLSDLLHVIVTGKLPIRYSGTGTYVLVLFLTYRRSKKPV